MYNGYLILVTFDETVMLSSYLTSRRYIYEDADHFISYFKHGELVIKDLFESNM